MFASDREFAALPGEEAPGLAALYRTASDFVDPGKLEPRGRNQENSLHHPILIMGGLRLAKLARQR